MGFWYNCWDDKPLCGFPDVVEGYYGRKRAMAKKTPSVPQRNLLSILSNGRKYGREVRQEYKNRYGKNVSYGWLYTMMRRMEAQGWVTSEWGEATPERGGNRKRYFVISEYGRQAMSRGWEIDKP